jgi:hypothetical protein
MHIYLDYIASTPIDPTVAAAMEPFLHGHFGNPSSGYWASVGAKAALEVDRGQVAAAAKMKSSSPAARAKRTTWHSKARSSHCAAGGCFPRRDIPLSGVNRRRSKEQALTLVPSRRQSRSSYWQKSDFL